VNNDFLTQYKYGSPCKSKQNFGKASTRFFKVEKKTKKKKKIIIIVPW
jgi:hypothetical protein